MANGDSVSVRHKGATEQPILARHSVLSLRAREIIALVLLTLCVVALSTAVPLLLSDNYICAQ
jgi:hypothetical protein